MHRTESAMSTSRHGGTHWIFYAVGTEILNLTVGFRWIFGAILIYSGVKTVLEDEDSEEDPKENRCIRCVTACLPVHDDYAPDGAFTVHVDESVNAALPPLGKHQLALEAVPLATRVGRRRDGKDSPPPHLGFVVAEAQEDEEGEEGVELVERRRDGSAAPPLRPSNTVTVR